MFCVTAVIQPNGIYGCNQQKSVPIIYLASTTEHTKLLLLCTKESEFSSKCPCLDCPLNL